MKAPWTCLCGREVASNVVTCDHGAGQRVILEVAGWEVVIELFDGERVGVMATVAPSSSSCRLWYILHEVPPA